MRKIRKKRFVLLMFILSIGFCFAGNLEPDNPPTSGTMKTLDEVEPRIPIKQADIPYTITTAGSYYLAENISLSTMNVNAITISVDNVTIDLKGFEIKGPGSGTTGHGIANQDFVYISGAVVQNGKITGWQDGVRLGGTDNSVKNIIACDNVGYGIFTGSQCLIKDCITSDNGPAGIYTGHNCVIKNCLSISNKYSFMSIYLGKGFEIGKSCTIINCCASENEQEGIYTNQDCVIESCTVQSNETNGITTDYSKIINCTATGNREAGIQSNIGSLIVGNVVDRNDKGIYLGGNGNVVRANHINENTTYGLHAGTAENYSAQNTLYNNGTNVFGTHKLGTGDMANITIP